MFRSSAPSGSSFARFGVKHPHYLVRSSKYRGGIRL
ncbi:MAG: hypothetical protein [Chaetfec virus UA24_2268]|nr:MAG: hypothetical protein [Chaetfec virus UA24_2268]